MHERNYKSLHVFDSVKEGKYTEEDLLNKSELVDRIDDSQLFGSATGIRVNMHNDMHSEEM